jgi:sulfide:quinone oxidoreductase
MSAPASSSKLRVVIAGGGVAGLETALALAELAPDSTTRVLIAPNAEFVYRPMTVQEPFAYPAARRYRLEQIVADAHAELVAGEVVLVEPEKQIVHTHAGAQMEYDALVLALGAVARPRYEHAITIDDRRLDEAFHGLLQDVEGGYIRAIAFVSPGRMAWPLPIYELALMTAARAYDMNLEIEETLITPEERPLAIFGAPASSAVLELLERSRIETINSAYAEVPREGEVVIHPGDRRLHVDRVVALPELYGPPLRGLPLGENGFIPVDSFGQVPGAGPIYAAGDATQFAVKHGGLAAQQADIAAISIAAMAGEGMPRRPFEPMIHGMLLTGEKPLYLAARISGSLGSTSDVTDSATWWPPTKIVAPYLAPYLEERDTKTGTPS